MLQQFQPGDRLGGLEILRELGRGAFAVVYLARDTVLGRDVALKVLSVGQGADAVKERSKLLQEARLVARLQSPHIVPLYRIHELEPSGVALEMEYLEGGSLADLLRSRPRLPVEEAVAHFRALLGALEVAHALGIVHRDIKPENLLFSGRGDLKLADFGLGRQVGEASLSGEHGKRVQGTPLYMSPEVVGGERATPASDLWSAGVVLYQMLAGRLPFAPGSLPALFYAIHHEEPEPLGPEHPAHLARIAAQCLEKDPARRPPSARALLGMLTGARARPAPEPVAGSARALQIPLGREDELESLEAALKRSEEGRGNGVLLLGEAGVGKSVLLEETLRRARERGSRVVDVALTPLGGLQRPLLTAVRRLLTGESEGAAWTAQLTSQRFGAATTLLRGMLLEDAFEVQTRQQLVWAIECLMRGFASERPVVLAVEDLQFGDGEDLRALGELVRRLSDARALVLAAYRAHDPSSSSSGISPGTPAMAELCATPGLATVHVAPLREDALAALASREAGVERLAPEVRERLREQSGGNPLFARELVRHLLAEGAIEVRGNRLERAPRWNEAPLPHRLGELVSMRLQRLTEEQRSLLDAAAVDGVAFDGTALAEVQGLNLLHVLRALQQLTREQALILPQKQGYRFAHTLFRDVIYRELAPDLRRHLHRALAEHLEAQGVAKSDPERAGTHWEQAGEAEKARPLLRQAALAAARRQDYTRALDLAQRGGVALTGPMGPVTPEEGDLLLALAGCLSDLGKSAEAEVVLSRLAQAAGVAGLENLRLRSLVWSCDLALQTRGLGQMDTAALREAGDALPDGYERGRAHYLLGYAAHLQGDATSAEASLRRADGIFQSSGWHHAHAQVLHVLGEVAKAQGKVASAIEMLEESARLKIAMGRRTDAAISKVVACHTGLEVGRLEGARTTLSAGIRELLLTGAEGRAAHASIYLARVEAAEGSYEAARARIERALRVLDGSELMYGRMDATMELAHVLMCMGATSEAQPHLLEAGRLAEQGCDADGQARVAALETKRRALAGDIGGIPAALAEAHRLFRPAVSPSGRAEAWLLLAQAAVYAARSGADPTIFGTPSVPLDDEPQSRAAVALLAAARVLHEPSADAEALTRAATTAKDHPVGFERAEVMLLSDCLQAEALSRRGQHQAALELRGRVREVALRLPHPALLRFAS